MSGDLAWEELPSVSLGPGARAIILRAEVFLAQAGPWSLTFADARGVQCWWDGQEQKLDDRIEGTSGAGRHELTLVIPEEEAPRLHFRVQGP